MTNSQISARELDERFDNGEDVLDFFDTDNPVVENHPPMQQRVTLTLPSWLVSIMDAEASHLAISRNAVVNTWLADKADSLQKKRALQDA